MSIYDGKTLIVKSNDGDGASFELCQVGNQQAVCSFIEDIGTHGTPYKNADGSQKFQKKIILIWELKEKMKSGEYVGKPFNIAKEYTNSLGKKSNLRPDLESWRGLEFEEDDLKGWNIYNVYGANCLLNIISYRKGDGSEGRKIGSISPAIKGMEKLFPVNTVPPKWIQKKRDQSVEANKQTPPNTDSNFDQTTEDSFDQTNDFNVQDDDLPF